MASSCRGAVKDALSALRALPCEVQTQDSNWAENPAIAWADSYSMRLCRWPDPGRLRGFSSVRRTPYMKASSKGMTDRDQEQGSSI